MTQRTRSTALAALALALATLLALATPAAAQDTEPPPPPPPTGEIRGTVTTGGDAPAPVVGATVALEPLDGTAAPDVPPAITDETGLYVFPNLPDGAYRVRVTAACFTEATADATVPPGSQALDVVLTNPPPVVETPTASLPSAPTGTEVTFGVTATDDCEPLTYAWEVDGDDDFDDAPAASYPVPGDYVAQVRVTDRLGATATSPPVTVTVTNRLPAVGPITASPVAPEAGQAVTLRAPAQDPEGRLGTVEWDLDGNGTYEYEQISAGVPPPPVSFPAGRTTVRVRATDRDGGSATAQLVLDVRERPVPPPPPQPRPPEPQPPTVVDPPRDTTAPAYTARSLPRQRLKTMRKRGLRFAVRCSEACTAYLEVLVDRRTARRLKIDRRARTDVRVGRAKVRLTAAGTRTASIKLTRKARAALKKPPRKMRLTVQGSAWDAGGYTSLLAPRRLTVKR